MKSRNISLRTALVGLLWIFVCAVPVMADGAIVGKVVNTEGKPIVGAHVLLVELGRHTDPDQTGVFVIESVPAGAYTLELQTRDFGSRIQKVTVTDGEETQLTMTVDVVIHEGMVISATPERKSVSDVAVAVGVVNEDELAVRMQPTLGETLADEPGVSSTYFGPVSSRPVIRGLGGDRIRVLEGGIETGDASTVSADHAVSVDMTTAERIEILRGPASLRYGSSAVGGVVNLVDNRIPEFVPHGPVSGQVLLRGDSASDNRTGAVNLTGGTRRIAYHFDLTRTQTHDMDIPGFAELEPDEGELPGTLENSAQELVKGTVGLSYVTDRGFFGAAFTRNERNYGVPIHEHGHDHDHDEEGKGAFKEEDDHDHEEEEGDVTIDMVQERVDVRGELRFEDSLFKAFNLRFGSTDYQHTELEGDVTGTRFENRFNELRTELTYGELAFLTSGSFGFQYSSRDFQAIGDEAFVPPNINDKYGLYVFSEVARPKWILTLASRLERVESEADLTGFGDHDHDHDHEDGEEEDHEDEDEHLEGPLDLSYTGISNAVGLILGRDREYSLGVNLTQTERAPTPEALFSGGPHLATGTFEVGNVDLKEETSFSTDLVLRKKEGVVTGELSLFYNTFDNFIYQSATGYEADGLEEFAYVQADAVFRGGEVHVDVELLHDDPNHLALELAYDYVRAELDAGEPLPRIPPGRFKVGLEFRRPAYWAAAEAKYTQSQDRLSNFETSTDSYTFVNISFGFRYFLGSTLHQVAFSGQNLGDEEGRNHTSFLKDRVPLPGRNLALTYRMNF